MLIESSETATVNSVLGEIVCTEETSFTFEENGVAAKRTVEVMNEKITAVTTIHFCFGDLRVCIQNLL
jgi:hypothetical protein